MNNITFSIHVPVYNVEEYLDKCINSILCQTYKNFELILTDDGSSDNSGMICDKYAMKDERVRVFHNKNQGLLMTRRFSVYKTRGEYCVFVDSDDYVEKNWLETINNTIRDTNSDIIVYSVNYVCNDKTIPAENVFDKQKIFEKESLRDFYYAFIKKTNLRCMWAKAIKSELILNDSTNYEKYSYVKIAEDFYQSIYPVFNAKRITYIPVRLYYYRQRENSNTHSAYENWCRDEFCVRNYALKYMELHGILDEEMTRYYASTGYRIALSSIYALGYVEGRKNIINKIKNITKDDFFVNFIKRNVKKSDLKICEIIFYDLIVAEKYYTLFILIKLRIGIIKMIKRMIKKITK